MKFIIRNNLNKIIFSIESNSFPKIIFIDYDEAKTKKYLNKYECLKYNQKWLNDKGYENSKGIIAINTESDSIVGYAFVLNNKMIFSVYVFDKYRKNGIGRTLLEKCIQKYNGNWLEVEKTNAIAINLYKSMNFEIIKEGMCYSEKDSSKKVPCYIMKYKGD